MNIRSVTTPATAQTPQTTAPSTSTPSSNTPATASQEVSADSFQPAQNERLVNMLQAQPEVRPDALERAKSLAADPNYPSSDTIEGLAKLFIANAGEE